MNKKKSYLLLLVFVLHHEATWSIFSILRPKVELAQEIHMPSAKIIAKLARSAGLSELNSFFILSYANSSLSSERIVELLEKDETLEQANQAYKKYYEDLQSIANSVMRGQKLKNNQSCFMSDHMKKALASKPTQPSTKKFIELINQYNRSIDNFNQSWASFAYPVLTFCVGLSATYAAMRSMPSEFYKNYLAGLMGSLHFADYVEHRSLSSLGAMVCLIPPVSKFSLPLQSAWKTANLVDSLQRKHVSEIVLARIIADEENRRHLALSQFPPIVSHDNQNKNVVHEQILQKSKMHQPVDNLSKPIVTYHPVYDNQKGRTVEELKKLYAQIINYEKSDR